MEDERAIPNNGHKPFQGPLETHLFYPDITCLCPDGISLHDCNAVGCKRKRATLVNVSNIGLQKRLRLHTQLDGGPQVCYVLDACVSSFIRYRSRQFITLTVVPYVATADTLSSRTGRLEQVVAFVPLCCVLSL